jgi:hypothetical protein
MFLNGQSWCNRRDGEQRARGSFLMLFALDGDTERPRQLRAFVRYVSMHQFGHFMMGSALIKVPGCVDLKVGLSGTYGHDGLPRDASMDLWPHLHPVPEEIAKVYWTDTSGHNSAGAEGPSMREWAIANIKTLRKLRKQPKAGG